MATRDGYGYFAESEKSFEICLRDLRDSLSKAGFGVLWEIDVQATMKEKLGAEYSGYTILGACKPPVAHEALQAEPDIGLLLPCNCIVRCVGDRVRIGAIDPEAQLGVAGNESLQSQASAIGRDLSEAVDRAAR